MSGERPVKQWLVSDPRIVISCPLEPVKKKPNGDKSEPITSLLRYIYISVEMKKLLERRLGHHSYSHSITTFLDQNCVVIMNPGAHWKVQLQRTCETSQLVGVVHLTTSSTPSLQLFHHSRKTDSEL